MRSTIFIWDTPIINTDWSLTDYKYPPGFHIKLELLLDPVILKSKEGYNSLHLNFYIESTSLSSKLQKKKSILASLIFRHKIKKSLLIFEESQSGTKLGGPYIILWKKATCFAINMEVKQVFFLTGTWMQWMLHLQKHTDWVISVIDHMAAACILMHTATWPLPVSATCAAWKACHKSGLPSGIKHMGFHLCLQIFFTPFSSTFLLHPTLHISSWIHLNKPISIAASNLKH